MPRLPDRILWIEPGEGVRVQLVEFPGICAEYIALSYCWGATKLETYLTDRTTLDGRRAGTEAAELPPLLQDVFTCARLLKVEYIWIDRLCIIQRESLIGMCRHKNWVNAMLTRCSASKLQLSTLRPTGY